MSKPYVIVYTKKNGRQEFTYEEWYRTDRGSIVHLLLHRVDGPAIEHADGTRYWYVNGKRHRTDGPSTEYSNGTKLWYIDDRPYGMNSFNKLIEAVKNMSLVMRLTDDRWWVREFKDE